MVASVRNREYHYAPYGEQTVMDASYAAKAGSDYGQYKGFTGQTLDPESGLWQFRNRYYSDGLGVYLGPDSFGYIDGMNRNAGHFAMRGGVDPSGNVVIFVHGIKSDNLRDTPDVYQGLKDAWSVDDPQAFIHFTYSTSTGEVPGALDAFIGRDSHANRSGGAGLALLIENLRRQQHEDPDCHEPIHVIAYSNGSNVAYHAAVTFGAQIDSLVMIGGSIDADLVDYGEFAAAVKNFVVYWSPEDMATFLVTILGSINGIGSRGLPDPEATEAFFEANGSHFEQWEIPKVAHSTNEADRERGLTIPSSSRRRVRPPRGIAPWAVNKAKHDWTTWLTYYMARQLYAGDLANAEGPEGNWLSGNATLLDGQQLNHDWVHYDSPYNQSRDRSQLLE